jgi:hypothetical protein
MGSQLSLSVLEIIVLMAGAITLGITIHFFIVSRRSLKANSPIIQDKTNKQLGEWKLRYLNDIEWKDKEIASLKKRIAEEEENNHIYKIESEELRKQNKQLQSSAQHKQTAAVPGSNPGNQIQQLLHAQLQLKEYNEKVNDLINQIDIVKETEAQQKELERDNEELHSQVEELRGRLAQKEREMSSAREKQELTREMSSMIDNAYSEFNVLQEKMQKLEQQVVASKKINLEAEDLKEENAKLIRDLEELKIKYKGAIAASEQFEMSLEEAEENFRAANFQRNQLQKRVNYLEDLNSDMQAVTEANKKLETQIKRIGELESMLNIMAEEKDELTRRQKAS